MLRCIEIAQNGLGITAPNPMVGAVLVHNDKIIGEGFTSAYGKAHAEVNAIRSVNDAALLQDATLYVTLEPCCHYGRTPPCADTIIRHNIPRVVVGVIDPNEKVAGKGIQKLKDAGCEVTYGVLANECRAHHKRFLTFHEKKRPYIILKWVETLDGFIAPEKAQRKENPEPYWITNSYSRQTTHQWRAEERAILVGTNTVLEDNPKLDARHWKGKNPFRIVIDRELKIPQHYHVLDESISTLVLTEVEDVFKYIGGVHYEILDFSLDLAEEICEVLPGYNITSLLVEGGLKTLQTFINKGLWDEARVFTGSTSFKKGTKAPEFSGRLIDTKKFGSDTLKYYRND